MIQSGNDLADRLVNFFELSNSIPEIKRRVFIALMLIGVVLLLVDLSLARFLAFDQFTITSEVLMVLFLTATAWLLVRRRERQELVLFVTFLGSALFLLLAMYNTLNGVSLPLIDEGLLRTASPWFIWFVLLDMASFLTFRPSTALRLSLLISVFVFLILVAMLVRIGGLKPASLRDFVLLFLANFLVVLMAYPLALSQERSAQTDFLTGLANRNRGYDMLSTEIERAQRYNEMFSVLLFDIDHFKRINDTHGHPGGDAVLREVGAFVEQHVRRTDLLCRWGGEEFLLLLPHTDLASARLKADHLRQQIKTRPFHRTVFLTVSFGATAYLPYDSAHTILERSDKALYRAKRNGRNCVEFE